MVQVGKDMIVKEVRLSSDHSNGNKILIDDEEYGTNKSKSASNQSFDQKHQESMATKANLNQETEEK